MANKVQCTGGHWFDISKFRYCPFCGLPAAVQAPVQPAAPMYMQQPPYQPVPPAPPAYQPAPPAPPVYQPVPPAPPVMPPMPPVPPIQSAAPVPESFTDVNANLPAGWLVGVGGPVKGKTYLLRENRNFVGTDASMDVVISDDPSVAACKHAVITYDPRTRLFYAQPGDARELYYADSRAVLTAVELIPGSLIEIGASSLKLLPLCGDRFGWDDATNS